MRRRLTVEVEGPAAVGAAVAAASDPSAKQSCTHQLQKILATAWQWTSVFQKLNVEKVAASKGWSGGQKFSNNKHMVLRVQTTLRKQSLLSEINTKGYSGHISKKIFKYLRSAHIRGLLEIKSTTGSVPMTWFSISSIYLLADEQGAWEGAPDSQTMRG
jgi:hypothetical protein